ncbi:NACHT domain-containing protein [Pedobacter alpinus]|uniref:NACHT domain-containing protein n=1 Tax=Pedobacter alpinus TaxID=1590643 RepID=A0ABW5TMZ7_9SPHI
MNNLIHSLSASFSPEYFSPPVETRQQELPFSEISWEYFEKLCFRLANSEGNVKDVRSYGTKGDKQEGIDIYAYDGNGKYIVYQCKNEKGFIPAKIKKAGEEFFAGKWANNAQKFVLCTREALNKRNREDEIIRQRQIFKDRNLTFEIWDSLRLNDKLREKPQLVDEFFGRDWVRVFCGKGIADSLSNVTYPKRNHYDFPEDYIPREVSSTEEGSVLSSFNAGSSLKEALLENKRIALLAWGQHGKSTELQFFAASLSKEDDMFPYLIRLGDYTDEDIISYIPDINKIPQDKLVILIDGLDEVSSLHFEVTSKKIGKFAGDFPNCSIVVSCRTNFYTSFEEDKSLNTVTGFSSFRLDELKYDSIQNFLNQHLNENKEIFLNEIVKKGLSDTLKTPYYLIGFAKEFQETGKVTNSKAAFFKREVGRLIKKDIHRVYRTDQEQKESELRTLLCKVAFTMKASGQTVIANQDLLEIISRDDFKLLREAGSLLQATDKTEKSWKFNQQSIHEYLAAEVLSHHNYISLKKHVGIQPKLLKISPVWLNTISFLSGILDTDSTLKTNITIWLTKHNQDQVIKLEPELLTNELRDQTFKNIFNFFKKKKRRINRTIYKPEQLARFGESESTLEFLWRETKSISKKEIIANILDIINSFQIQLYPIYEQRFKEFYGRIIFKDDVDLQYLALRGYTSVFKLTPTEFEVIFQKFKYHDDTWIRYSLFYAIWNKGHANEYIDYILSQANFLINEEKKNFNKSNSSNLRLSNENTEIKHCIEHIDSEKGLLKLFETLKTKLVSLASSNFFNAALIKSIERASLFVSSQEMIRSLQEVFLLNQTYIINQEKFRIVFIDFFKQAQCVDQLCKLIYDPTNIKSAEMISRLGALATPKFIDLLKNDFYNGLIDQNSITRLEHFMRNAKNENISYLRSQFNIKVTPVKNYTDYKKQEEKARKRDLNALFNKNIFIEEVKLIFKAFNTDKLNKNAIYSDTDPDYWSSDFCNVARDFLDIRSDSNEVILEEVIQSLINSSDKDYFQIYEYVKQYNEAVLNDVQLEEIVGWCDDKVKIVDFKKAIIKESELEWSYNTDALLLSFFIRRFNLQTYSKILYLDMLSFTEYGESIIKIFEFVETVCSKAEITYQVLQNLHNGIDNFSCFSNHLNYVTAHKIVQSLPYLKKYFEVFKDNYDLLKSYLSLSGKIDDLEVVLLSSTGYFRDYLIEQFITHQSSIILNYLNNRFKTELDIKEKLCLAKSLIKLQDKKGIKYYIEYIQKSKQVPDDSSQTNPLYQLKKISMVHSILELLILSYDPEIKFDYFNNLTSICINALRNIALAEGNFPKAHRSIKLFLLLKRIENCFSNNKFPQLFFSDLEFYWEGIEQQHLVNLSVPLSLSEAIISYKKFAL